MFLGFAEVTWEKLRERRSLHVQVNKERVRMMWEVRLPFSAWCSLDLLVETMS